MRSLKDIIYHDLRDSLIRLEFNKNVCLMEGEEKNETYTLAYETPSIFKVIEITEEEFEELSKGILSL